ncbi:MAG: DegT/DnrJ/EryC1/StrS family aminotransferase [Planctomycetota bacterium]|nr:DegT/DnrJ/EryC1/StrS family aminotransferase [Planctomycetota bacterium]MDA1212724.1 DegT/DnrJ/EryC1/StrS family aminotransferase [Planctomycetota bacterium]
MKVPFLDLRAQNLSLGDELRSAFYQVMDNSQFILGPAVEQFERDFAAYVGTAHCVGLNNGTSALHMALLAYDIGPGDEVITTPHTWISTTWAISYVGATPVYVDIDPVTFNLDPEKVTDAITPKTKAILPVHLYGQAADIVQLRRIADDHELILIEDTAQAHGAEFDGQRLGSIGQIGCFSFYPGKNLGAFGEGGAIVTSDDRIADRIRRLRDHAQQGRHHHVEIGYNTRMEGLQGAVLSVKLRQLDRWNSLRRQHAQTYCELLDNCGELELPASPTPEAHVWHLFVVLLKSMSRDDVQKQLAERGIASAVHYPTPVPYQPAYAHLGYKRGDFPVAEDVTSRCLSLPMFPELTSEQMTYVATTLKDILAKSTVDTVAKK